MPIIGAHVSAAGSLELSFDKASEMGAECTQIFLSPPRQWFYHKHDQAEILRYKEAAKTTGIGPNFIHGTYLINLATEKKDHLQKSIDWLIYSLNMAGELGISGIIFHTGSHQGRGFEVVSDQIAKTISIIIQQCYTSDVEHKPYLILENSAGAGGSVGRNFSELGQILKKVKNKRLKVCLDTAHAYTSGYDIKTNEGLKKVLAEFDKEIGLENLVAIHANDSKFDIGTNRDRHENIGDGFIGKDGFKNLISHPKLKNIPFITEVPGYEGNGPDKKNVDILKSLRQS